VKEMFTKKAFEKSVTMALVLMAAGFTVSCGKKTTSNAPPPAAYQAPVADTTRKTTANSGERYPKLVIGINADPTGLTPWNINVGTKPQIYHNFYEGLFDMEGSEYIPVLAKGYEVIDDLHYDVEIYDYIYDHAGNNITADDILYSYKVLIDSGYNLKWASFKNIEKVNDYKVRFTWTSPVVGVGDLEFPLCRTVIFSKRAYEGGNFATQLN
jgi:ABC-type transport system substrate-binding protein